MALAMKSRVFKAGAAAPRPAARSARAAVVRASRDQEVTLVDRLAPSLLAAVVTLSGATAIDAVYAPAARADDEETMSPYQKRQAELERRRELLREAREKAAARASGTAEEAAAPAAAEPAPAPASDFASRAADLKKGSLSSYESASKNRPATPAPTPAETEEPSKPAFGGFSFSKPAEPAPAPAAPAAAPSSSFSAPPDPWKSSRAPVAPVAPVPVPVPVPVPAPAPAKIEVKKAEPAKPAPAPAKPASDLTPSGKHRTHGFLPLWFAEILVLGSYVGMGLAATKYASQTEAVLKAAGQKIKEAYEAADKLVGSKLKGSSA